MFIDFTFCCADPRQNERDPLPTPPHPQKKEKKKKNKKWQQKTLNFTTVCILELGTTRVLLVHFANTFTTQTKLSDYVQAQPNNIPPLSISIYHNEQIHACPNSHKHSHCSFKYSWDNTMS
jgi:hypothetical protein